MTYTLAFTDKAREQLREWQRSGQDKDLKKIDELLAELRSHPADGHGEPEQLCGDLDGCWSRRIDHGDRLVYTIDHATATVTVTALKSHYATME